MAARNELAENLREFVLAVLGITLMVSILLIWVAWTKTIYLAVLATIVIAGVFYCALYAYHLSRDGDRLPHANSRKTRILTNDFQEELHGLTYHGRYLGDRVFRRKTERLRSMMHDRDNAGSEEEETEK